MATTTDLTAYLSNNNVSYRIRVHVPTYSVSGLAAANHASEKEIARNRVFEAENTLWMAVFPGNLEIEMDALRRALHTTHVRELADSDLKDIFPDCDVEAIPPFGNLYGLNVIADPHFERNGLMVFNACSPTSSIIIAWSEFRRLVRPVIARITEPVHLLEKTGA